MNRQGNDVGNQYRQAIFPHLTEQESEARAATTCTEGGWPDPIVTTIEPLSEWYPAEDYYQEYFARVGDQNPCRMAVIAPKRRKFRKSYAERLKR